MHYAKKQALDSVNKFSIKSLENPYNQSKIKLILFWYNSIVFES